MSAVGSGGGDWFDVDEPSELAGIPLARASAFAPSGTRPVLQVAYALSIDVAQKSNWDQLIESMSFSLGEAKEQRFPLQPYGAPSGQVRVSTHWRVGAVNLYVSAWHGQREERGLRSTGGLYINHDEGPLAQPFLDEYEARSAPWRNTPMAARVLRVPVPGLRSVPTESRIPPREYFALYQPNHHPAPSWAVQGLGDSELSIWMHDAGYCGIADRGHSWVNAGTFADKRFTLVRVRPAKGSGYSALNVEGREWLASSEPGESGLDAVADRLSTLGASVVVTEDADC